MKKFHTLGLLLLCLQLNLVAQERFSNGNIITQNGDTISGSVSNFRSSDFIKFRPSNEDKFKNYFLKDLLGFTIDGNVFKKIIANIQYKFETRLDTVFMQLLVQGNINLFYLKDKLGDEYYFVEKSGVMNQLSNTERDVYKNGISYQVYTKEYLVILNNLFEKNECIAKFRTKNMQLDENLVKFKKSNLIEIIHLYNGCKNKSKNNIVLYKKSPNQVFFGLRLGYNNTTIQVKDSGLSPFSSVSGMSAGIFLNFPLTGVNQHLLSQIELNFNQKGASDKNGTQIKLDVFDLAFLLKRTAINGKVRPFFGVGFLCGLLKPETFKNFEMGLLGEIGLSVPLNKQSLLFAIRHERTNIGLQSWSLANTFGLRFIF